MATFNRLLTEKVVHQKAENLKELCICLSGEDSKLDKEAFEETYKTICKKLLSHFIENHVGTLIENRNDVQIASDQISILEESEAKIYELILRTVEPSVLYPFSDEVAYAQFGQVDE